MRRAALLAVVLAALTTGLAVRGAARTAPDRRASDQLKAKFTAIERQADIPSREARRTTLTQDELNAYLAAEGAQFLPAGLEQPVVDIAGSGRVSGRAIVDLDAIRQQRNATNLLDPTAYLIGRVPVTATGVLHTSNGMGRFELEDATAAGVPVPRMLLQQIVSHYSRSPERPSGVSLDDAFPLPARIQAIEVQPGRAIIVQ